ncbi:hypothetical protein ACFSUS_28005 [Spirosoma soli]|uniref:GLPGLI family protein n=1 Tax=Spirosoma soli TaxID=1770529 RepID=A0ABW5MBW1_9BACT
MEHKTIAYLLLVFLPALSIAQSKTVEISLKSVDNYFAKAYNQVGTEQSTDLSGFQGIPDYLVERVIRFSNTVRGQSKFEEYQMGKLTPAEWEKAKASCACDTTALSPAPLKQRINTLVGTDKQGRRVVIVDANNNQNFSDDRVLRYPMTLPTIERYKNGFYTHSIHAVYDTLPAVRVQIEAFDGKKIIPRYVWVKPNPYNSGWTYLNPIENQFHLTLLAHEYRSGNGILRGKPVYFIVTSGTAGLPYSSPMATIEIRQDPQALSSALGKPEYRIGQSFILDNHRIEITRISLQGDKLLLTDKGLANATISKPAEK